MLKEMANYVMTDPAMEIEKIDHFLIQVLDSANTAFLRFQKNTVHKLSPKHDELAYQHEITELENYLKSIEAKINDFSEKLNLKKELTLLATCYEFLAVLFLAVLRKKQLADANMFSQAHFDACVSDMVNHFKKCKNAIEASLYQYRTTLVDFKITPFPDDLWKFIFQKVDQTDLPNIAQTSKRAFRLTNQSSVWEKHAKDHFLSHDEIQKIKEIHPNLNFKQVVKRAEQFSLEGFKIIFTQVLRQKVQLRVDQVNNEIEKQVSDNNKKIPGILTKFNVAEFKNAAKKILKKYISEDRANQKSELKGFYRLKQIFSFLFKDFRNKINLEPVSEEDWNDINYFNKGETEKNRAEIYFNLLATLDKITDINSAKQFLLLLKTSFKKCVLDSSSNLTKRVKECYFFTNDEIQKIDDAIKKVQETSEQMRTNKLLLAQELQSVPVQGHGKSNTVVSIINKQYQLYKNDLEQNNCALVKICNELTKKENALRNVQADITETENQINSFKNHNAKEKRRYDLDCAEYANNMDCWASYDYKGRGPTTPSEPRYLADKDIQKHIAGFKKELEVLEAFKEMRAQELEEFKTELTKNGIKLTDILQVRERLKPDLDAATQLNILRTHAKGHYYKTITSIKDAFPNEFEVYLTDVTSEFSPEKNQRTVSNP